MVAVKLPDIVFGLTISLPEKLKNLIFEMSIITQTLSINNLRTTSAKSINLHDIRKLVEYSLKNVISRLCLLLPFSRYCFPKIGWDYHSPSGVQRVKGLKFQWKTKKILGICWNSLESDWLTSLVGFEWFLDFFDFV